MMGAADGAYAYAGAADGAYARNLPCANDSAEGAAAFASANAAAGIGRGAAARPANDFFFLAPVRSFL